MGNGTYLKPIYLHFQDKIILLNFVIYISVIEFRSENTKNYRNKVFILQKSSNLRPTRTLMIFGLSFTKQIPFCEVFQSKWQFLKENCSTRKFQITSRYLDPLFSAAECFFLAVHRKKRTEFTKCALLQEMVSDPLSGKNF